MRQMMGAMGQQTGMLGKIPGFRQISQMRQMTKMAAGVDLSQIMSAAGLQQGERRFSVPQVAKSTTADRNKEKRKRKEAKKQRKKNKRK
jgi:signal recognition particle subunit SRP54